MTIDRDKVLKMVAEYVYFLLDNEPKGEADAAAYDSRRRKLHNAIAEIMGVSRDGVKNHFRHISGKLGTRDRVETIAVALRRGLIHAE